MHKAVQLILFEHTFLTLKFITLSKIWGNQINARGIGISKCRYPYSSNSISTCIIFNDFCTKRPLLPSKGVKIWVYDTSLSYELLPSAFLNIQASTYLELLRSDIPKFSALQLLSMLDLSPQTQILSSITERAYLNRPCYGPTFSLF